VLLDVGLGAACELAQSWIHRHTILELRDLFWQRLNEEFTDVVLNGHPTERLPNTLNVSFPGRNGAEILHALNDVAASTGSACHSGVVELSPVLKAMRVRPEIGMGAVRFSLGRSTTAQELESVVQSLKEVLA
jgi:cysteine desulfurase